MKRRNPSKGTIPGTVLVSAGLYRRALESKLAQVCPNLKELGFHKSFFGSEPPKLS